MKKQIFNNFEEYWSYARFFTVHQRDILLSNLPTEQRQYLMKSYMDGGWEDLVMRNELDAMLDIVREDTSLDLLQIRCQVLLRKKKIVLEKSQWDYIQDVFCRFKQSHIQYIFGGVVAENRSRDTVLLVKE